jgi:hypothetical protein
MNEPTKQTVASRVKNAYVKHERKILVTLTVASTGAALVMRSGIAQHNAFLKEHGLYEQFYAIAENVEA